MFSSSHQQYNQIQENLQKWNFRQSEGIKVKTYVHPGQYLASLRLLGTSSSLWYKNFCAMIVSKIFFRVTLSEHCCKHQDFPFHLLKGRRKFSPDVTVRVRPFCPALRQNLGGNILKGSLKNEFQQLLPQLVGRKISLEKSVKNLFI